MRIVFFGTPYYVVPILDSLNKAFKQEGKSPIAAVVTQPPRPVGRKQLLKYSEVDNWAHKKGVPKFLKASELIKNNIKADVGILASYGELIPNEVIRLFPHGILVVHPSLLPEFRWGSPVPAAIITGTNPTGVSIIKMDDKWDHGPVVATLNEEISADDTYESLRDRLFARSAEILIQMLPAYLKGKIKLKPQDDKKASFARIIKKEDAFIPPKILKSILDGKNPKAKWKIGFLKINGKAYSTTYTPETVYRLIRAMDPWPTVWTYATIDSKKLRLRILKASLNAKNKGLQLKEVQLEGKNNVTWEEFVRGYPKASFI